MALLTDAFIYLTAAVVAVPVANRLGLGSVIGYLLAGVAIGPLLGIVGDEMSEVQHFAEFGVVMMLFLVGLELQPAMLWRMRRQLIGLGGLQVFGTSLLIAGGAWLLGLEGRSALAIGMILSLSSTAIVLQTLNEQAWMHTTGGRSAFSVLLTQDIAVIPMLGLLPLLALGGHDAAAPHAPDGHAEATGAATAAAHHGGAALAALPVGVQALVILAVIAAIIIAGRHLIRPVFRFIAAARLREIFTAAALLLVIGIALLMEMVGLSPALGTFLAGVVLSDSEFRHELEIDIAPFKGMLLGLFFLTVGAGIDFGLLVEAPGFILGLAAALMLGKTLVLYGLASLFRLNGADRWLFALGLAQAGEFAFVLFGFALDGAVLAPALVERLTMVVAVTMLLTPVLFTVYERVVAPRSLRTPQREADRIDRRGTVVIAGMGRFGQIVTRLLTTNGFSVVVLEHDPETIENARKIGIRAYYGDATRHDLLHAAGLDKAALFVAALDDRDKQTAVVAHVACTYRQVRILARAVDRHHVYELENAGAHIIERALFEGALALGKSALTALGVHPFRAETQARAFRRHDRETLDALRDKWNEAGADAAYLKAMRRQTDALYEVMRTDRADQHERGDRGWTPPPKDDAAR